MTVFRKKNIHILAMFFALVVLFNLNDCEAPNYPASLWQDDVEGRPDPIITQVEPEDGTLTGIGISITGTFSAWLSAIDRTIAGRKLKTCSYTTRFVRILSSKIQGHRSTSCISCRCHRGRVHFG